MMFGRLYDRIDGVLGKPIDAGEVFEVEHYASLLLADLLDRCRVLHLLFLLGDVSEMKEEEVRSVIHVFKRDCDEVRARGERLGLLFEPGEWTESAGEHALMGMGMEESVTVHPYAHAKWRERIGRQVARHPVPEWARTTPKTKEESSSPETGE